jgi:hypothetical protein
MTSNEHGFMVPVSTLSIATDLPISSVCSRWRLSCVFIVASVYG